MRGESHERAILLQRGAGEPHLGHDPWPADAAWTQRAGDRDGPVEETIRELEAILSDPARLRAVISTELESVKQQHAEPRRTRVVHDPGELFVEDLIEDEELVVTLTRAGYIKAVQADAFRAQARGGRGVQGPSSRKRT